MKREGGYAPLNAYGMIGDCRAGALVASDGAIDWFATPRLDSEPVCAALLDPSDGGAITLEPAVPYESSQRYVEDTLVLRTTFRCAEGTVTVTDALNRGSGGPLPWTELARRVEGVAGRVPMRWTVRAGHRLGTARPWTLPSSDTPVIEAGAVRLAVVTDGMGAPADDGGGVSGEVTVDAGATGLLAVLATRGEPLWLPGKDEIRTRTDRTIDFWRRWCGDIGYDGPHREIVTRAAGVLKALTLEPSYAIMAALTTSLPERIGGALNFDYRFGWIRDTSFALDAMARIGLTEEVHAALSWVVDAISHTAPRVRSMYTLDGAPASPEMTSDYSLPGYRGSTPVTIGNGAATQTQLGAYGDLMDAVGRYAEHGGMLDSASADTLGSIVDHTCDVWRGKDAGIWELGTHEHYTISKMGCWVALDRAVRLAESGQLSSRHLRRWRLERDAVRAWTDEHCWSSTKGSYTFHAGTDEVDAAVLLAARTGYLAGDDPRLASTIDTVRTELTATGPLLYRFSGSWEHEGAFLACGFWLIEALAQAGRRDEACRLFEEAVRYGSESGIRSEQADPDTGELLGNLPQGLTHLSVIGAATTLWPPKARG